MQIDKHVEKVGCIKDKYMNTQKWKNKYNQIVIIIYSEQIIQAFDLRGKVTYIIVYYVSPILREKESDLI